YLEGEKTGYEFWLECQRQGIRAPFLLTSAYTSFQRGIANELPFKFVPKPFAAWEMRSTLREMLQPRQPQKFMALLKSWFADEEVRLGLSLLLAMMSLLTLAVYFSHLGDLSGIFIGLSEGNSHSEG